MPTYRIPVRGRFAGYVVVLAADAVLAAEKFRNLENVEPEDISGLDLVEWLGGIPVEVKP